MNTTPIEFIVFDTDASEFVDDERLFYFTLNDMRYNDPYNFMQCTALRSINDEPIYNHMIVKDEHGDHFIIDMFSYMKMYALSIAKLEIVGNRFQHSHLLEKCK